MIIAVIILMSICTIISTLIVYLYYKKYRYAFSFKETIDKTNLPIVSLSQGDKTFNFLIDSGATTSVLNEDTIKDLQHTPLQGKSEICGVGDNNCETYYVGVQLSAKKCNFIEIFEVCNIATFTYIEQCTNVKIHGLLGSPFLKRYNFLIDYNKNKAYTNGHFKKDKTANP